jgi:hypothetical protein
MMHSTFRSAPLVSAFVVCCALPSTLTAQVKSRPAAVVTIDPYGVANQRLTAEAEFCGHGELSGSSLGCGLDVGLAATIERHPRPAGSKASKHHADAEGFIRLRSHGLTGWWLGLRTGLTFADRYGVGPSLGVETGMSWLMARRLYIGGSVGAKKVFALDDDSALHYNPAFRLATGIAF